MRIETIFQMKSPYRDDFRIDGYWFGSGEKTVAIVGAMRGDEIQQQYICARIVEALKEAELRGKIADGKSILVIPSCNPFSMNVSKRFWAMDGTDINRMFPGYDKGETTQRIAAAVFEYIKDFEYGMQMASFYMPGDFVPHVRMLKTGYEDIETAQLFGMPFVTVRKPLSPTNKRLYLSAATMLAVIVIDQIIKVYVKTHFLLHESVDVTPWFKLVFIENRGMAFGMDFIGTAVLTVFRIAAIIFFCFILRRAAKHLKPFGLILCIALIIAGAAGNIIDNCLYGLIFTSSIFPVFSLR